MRDGFSEQAQPDGRAYLFLVAIAQNERYLDFALVILIVFSGKEGRKATVRMQIDDKMLVIVQARTVKTDRRLAGLFVEHSD